MLKVGYLIYTSIAPEFDELIGQLDIPDVAVIFVASGNGFDIIRTDTALIDNFKIVREKYSIHPSGRIYDEPRIVLYSENNGVVDRIHIVDTYYYNGNSFIVTLNSNENLNYIKGWEGLNTEFYNYSKDKYNILFKIEEGSRERILNAIKHNEHFLEHESKVKFVIEDNGSEQVFELSSCKTTPETYFFFVALLHGLNQFMNALLMTCVSKFESVRFGIKEVTGYLQTIDIRNLLKSYYKVSIYAHYYDGPRDVVNDKEKTRYAVVGNQLIQNDPYLLKLFQTYDGQIRNDDEKYCVWEKWDNGLTDSYGYGYLNEEKLNTERNQIANMYNRDMHLAYLVESRTIMRGRIKMLKKSGICTLKPADIYDKLKYALSSFEEMTGHRFTEEKLNVINNNIRNHLIDLKKKEI